ncbi:hypothetical protein GVO57_09595 [Sphingomonas changnyeongensis]|uniref:Uncharacterized protein n=1 Tax=Sphingomonas changnyeongensis TaxID=2698679 RepID=A0A7Z2NWB9_9SPHN|nr:hypothetical protein [Sphingomonas changnyeongensis]QHL91026.1 hypothetical protein GVO57_09595 [Sphingomonas changnyeongensis]
MAHSDPSPAPAGSSAAASAATMSDRIDAVRARTGELGEDLTRRIADTPLLALAGGIAIGALIGAALPPSQRERRTLGPVGRKLGAAAAEASRAAVSAGKQELGIGTAAKSPVEALADRAIGAVAAAGQAAAGAVKTTKKP